MCRIKGLEVVLILWVDRRNYRREKCVHFKILNEHFLVLYRKKTDSKEESCNFEVLITDYGVIVS